MRARQMLGTAVLTLAMATVPGTASAAKQWKTVKGERGTVWCCPDGKKGPDCVKFSNGTPIGKNCQPLLVGPDTKTGAGTPRKD